MIDGNALLNDFISKNWMLIILLYGILGAIFPGSELLKRLGQAFADRFPVFGKKEKKDAT